MNLKKLTRGILAIGVAFAIVLVPNTARFANAANTPSVEVNDTLNRNHHESQHFWTEKDDHTGTKTNVQITIINHSSKSIDVVIREDVKGYGDNWYWNGASWSFDNYDYLQLLYPTVRSLSPGEITTFTVTTNTDQGAIKGHVRGVYVSASLSAGDTLDVNMKKVN
ncbi:MAG: hypothetical protein LBI63_04850 [Candidatus Ancillula sp.]|jgi:hypothetical protein|nr:hypothetical protein [Candidatus Ancillula sp.]